MSLTIITRVQNEYVDDLPYFFNYVFGSTCEIEKMILNKEPIDHVQFFYTGTYSMSPRSIRQYIRHARAFTDRKIIKQIVVETVIKKYSGIFRK